MADYSTLKAAVADVVKTNGSQAITGANLQTVLLSIINSIGGGGYIFAGVATPSTSVGTPDQNVFYITGAGTFANMGTSVTVPVGAIGIFKYNGSWSNSQIRITDENTLIHLGYYDVSAHNSGASYASLSDALAAVPTSYRRGGMTVKYKDSVLGKYVQYRLTTLTWSATPSNWQGVDDGLASGSNNLATSGSVYAGILHGLANSTEVVKTDLHVTIAGSSDSFIATDVFPVEEGALYKVTIDNTEQWTYNSSVTTDKTILFAYHYGSSETNFDFTNYILRENLLRRDSIPYTGEAFFVVPTGYGISFVRLRALKSNDLSCVIRKVKDSYLDLLDGDDDLRGKRVAKDDFTLKFLFDTNNVAPYNEQSSNRLRYYFANEKGYPVYINACCYGYQLKINVVPINTMDLLGGGNVMYTVNSSYNAVASGFIPEGYKGYIAIHFRKVNDGIFTNSDITNILNRAIIDIYYDPARYNANIGEDEHEIHIGSNLLNKAIVSNGWGSDSDIRVSTHDLLAFPYNGNFVLKFYAPKCFGLGMREGTNPTDLANRFWLFDGGTAWTYDNQSVAPIRKEAIWYRFVWGCMAYIDGAYGAYTYKNISTTEIAQLIEYGLLKVTYVLDGNDRIIENNSDNEKYLRAMLLDPSRETRNGYANAIIMHSSDIHGDFKRAENFMTYADYLGADIALISGDIVIFDNTNGADYMTEIDANFKTPLAVCVGNHETTVNTLDGIATTDKTVYDILLAGLVSHTKNGWVMPSIQYPTYFYRDITDKKIRVISLNLYEGGQMRVGDYSGNSDRCHPSQTQVNWFISTLQSTPNDYGIMVMCHTALNDINRELTDNDSFYTKDRAYWSVNNGWDGTKFIALIDALISRSSISTSYEQSTAYKGISGTETIYINADFSNLDSSVEFIAWVNGHEHSDCVGYLLGATNKQVQLNVCCGNGVNVGKSYALLSDLPRGGKGSVQDSFNVYSIDRKNKTIRIARVGSNTTFYNSDRKTMIIDYI